MINREFAQRFVKKISKQLGYSVNVMNEKAIIIASVEKSRIGDFHTGAYMMIHQNQSMQVVHEVGQDMLGVRAGVNMLIRERGVPVGVVGITGVPEEVMESLKLVKLMFDTMLEYENNKQNNFMEKKGGNELIYALLFEKPQSIGRIQHFAKQVGYHDRSPRVQLLIKLHFPDAKENIAEEIIKQYRQFECYHNQDIVCQLSVGYIMILKYLSIKNLGEYKKCIQECFNEVISKSQNMAGKQEQDYLGRGFCGIPQSGFENYAVAYEHVEWLMGYLKEEKNEEVYFVQDYISEYLSTHVTPKQKMDILMEEAASIVRNVIGMDGFIETAAALLDSNMRIEEAASRLFVHKNTIIYRVKKIKEALGIDPINNYKDSIFLGYLSSYCICYMYSE